LIGWEKRSFRETRHFEKMEEGILDLKQEDMKKLIEEIEKNRK